MSIFFASLAPAALDDHVLVLLEHHVGRLVEVEHRKSGQLGRSAAGHRDQLGVEAVGKGLGKKSKVIRIVALICQWLIAASSLIQFILACKVPLFFSSFVALFCYEPEVDGFDQHY